MNALTATNEGGASNAAEFASFKSGTTYKVRVLGAADLIQFHSYGIFKRVNSFSAKNPSKKNAKGFPVENLTPWDKAAEYYQKLSFAARDAGDEKKARELSDQAYIYRAKQRFALGFIDLATGKPIIVDLSKKQAQAVHAVIKKNEKKLDKKAFELEKSGEGTGTVVMLSPTDLEDLTAEEQANFAKYDGQSFDMSLFDGLLYEADDAEQLQLLTQAGFDISLIGASANVATQADDATEEPLPF